MNVRLIENLATTREYAEVFSDASLLRAMLDFEAALARAEASSGVIPARAARKITQAARAGHFDTEALSEQGLRAGTLTIPLVKALTEKVRKDDEASARFVHWGATSQDVSDTATVLLLRQAWKLLDADHARLQQSLRRESDRHAKTIMLGRTLLQPAPPVTLGLKIAGWFAALQRGWKRLDDALEAAMVLQFGGASGTLAALGKNALPVSKGLARNLQLALPEAPWHTHRDRLAAVICACGIYTGSLAKIARDVSLLMQKEVAEAAEAGGDGRGGSSTMPQKSNPIACALTIAANTRVSGLVSSFLFGMAQEHERAVGGWHAESATISRVIQDTGLALASVREIAEGLKVDAARMRENLAATRGVIFAERAAMLLAGKLGKKASHKIVRDAAQQAVAKKRSFKEVLGSMSQVTRVLSAAELRNLDEPAAYLGAAEIFRKQLLSSGE